MSKGLIAWNVLDIALIGLNAYFIFAGVGVVWLNGAIAGLLTYNVITRSTRRGE